MDENRNAAAIKLFGKRIPLLKEASGDEGKVTRLACSDLSLGLKILKLCC